MYFYNLWFPTQSNQQPHTSTQSTFKQKSQISRVSCQLAFLIATFPLQAFDLLFGCLDVSQSKRWCKQINDFCHPWFLTYNRGTNKAKCRQVLDIYGVSILTMSICKKSKLLIWFYLTKKIRLSSADGLHHETEEESLHVAGLREKRLIVLFVWLAILGILAIVVLIVSHLRFFKMIV